MRTRDAAKRREKLVALCTALPEAEYRGGQHGRFSVRGKTFAYYLFDHHGDGKIAVTCKVPPGMHALLAAADPERFFVPPYLGPKGWIALRLDTEKVDWKEVEELVGGSYRLIAPKSLASKQGRSR
jgi:phosphoribosylglycinamide formyltransferase-1